MTINVYIQLFVNNVEFYHIYSKNKRPLHNISYTIYLFYFYSTLLGKVSINKRSIFPFSHIYFLLFGSTAVCSCFKQ